MRTVTEFPYEIAEHADMGITLSDGCRLSARVWLPEGAGKVPAILEFLPYRKRDGTTARDCLTHPYFAGHGYACLRVDMRGNGDSEGVMDDEYSPQELSDACEVIDWIAAQDWCSGAVGMMGISWGGFNSLQVAALRPKPLKAIITLCSTVDRFADDIHFKGGCLLNENLGWGGTMLSYSSRPPDPALVGEKWREMWLERLEAEPFLAADWLRHQTRDAYWRHGSVCEDFSTIEAAVLAVGGWGDSYKNAPDALLKGLKSPAKAIIGPWVHKYPHFAVPEPRIGFLQEALRWWDRWLKGADTGADRDPAMRAYLMDSVRPKEWYATRPGRWIAEPDWPAPAIETRTLGLNRAGLGPAAPFETLVASPQDCGLDGGEYCAIWLGPEMPGDQRRDDALSACFDGQPLDAPTDIVGAPEVELRLRADKPQAQIAVRLCEVHPDGASTRITYGVLNLLLRDDRATPMALPVGDPVTVRLTLDQIAYRAAPGNRLRLAISTAYWPLIWPAPEAASITLLAGALHLPLRPTASGDECAFAQPEAAPAWKIETLRPAAHGRRVERDLTTGLVTTIIEDDFGETRDRDHGLTHGGVARERWSIHPDDPLSARGETHWTATSGRGAWSTRTEAKSAMWSDAESFHLTASIEAWEGDEQVFEKRFEETIPRLRP
jgi:putative CocE/NonD family hydrolase